MRFQMPHARTGLDEVTDKNQRILLVDSDDQFREGLYNFLLAAGYDNIDAAASFSKAGEKMLKSAYDIVISEAGSRRTEGLAFAENIVKLNPQMKHILMIKDENQENWTEQAGSAEFQFLLKSTFPQNLLYLLHH